MSNKAENYASHPALATLDSVVHASELLGNELVIRAAWHRLEAWYRSQEWRPEPELTRFRVELHGEVTRLSKDLTDGTYRPSAFHLLPYPKSQTHLRHYCVASVRDQLAFATFAVLLGPFIEFSLTNNVFGNRWYRGMKRDLFQGREPAWMERPFSLDAPAFYMPYRRDYGLFRRVAAWSAAAMLNVERAALHTRPEASSPSEYPRDRLPDFVNAEVWGNRADTGHWARLDLRLAYPSVRIDLLERELAAIASDPDVWLASSIESLAFPKAIAESMGRDEVRVELVSRLAMALRSIQYNAGPIRDEHWVPAVADKFPAWRLPRTNSDHCGLPTGLAVAGLLFNAYMRPVDRSMAQLRTERDGGLAYLRFADDIVLLGRSSDDIAEGIARLESFAPTAPNDRNLLINTDKAKPTPWREFLGTAPEKRKHPRIDAEHLLTKERLGPFVTYLVERMSEIGNDDPRFGDPARRHLIALHELIRLELPDDEVKSETRLAFAANRIAKAFLPIETGDAAQTDLREIAESIRIAMRAAPQKFAMWRAAIRAAARRSMELAGARKDAAENLTTLVREIRCEPMVEGAMDSVDSLRKSFLRAIFWREVASVLADLRRVFGVGSATGSWPTRSWTFRAVDEVVAEDVHQWLANLDQWAATLYGTLGTEAPSERWSWELDSLVLAELAAAAPSRLSGDSIAGDTVYSHLTAPVPATNVSLVQQLLVRAQRATNLDAWNSYRGIDRLVALAIARAYIGPGAENQVTRAVQSLLLEVDKRDIQAATLVARELGCLPLLNRSQHNRAPSASILALHAQALRRGQVLHRTKGRPKRRRISLFELLWAVRDSDGALFAPGRAPAIELPVRVALRLLRHAIAKLATRTPFDSGDVERGPLTWLLTKQPNRLLRSRLEQIWNPNSNAHIGEALVKLELSERKADWPMPPHPAFDLVVASGGSRGDDADIAWSALLHFFVALTGDERWLDRLCTEWGFRIPLDESWHLRAAAPMPTEMWSALDDVARHCLNLEGARALAAFAQLSVVIDRYLQDEVGDEIRVRLAEFGWDRADIHLSLGDGPLDVPMGTGSLNDEPREINIDKLSTDFAVRVGQISTSTTWSTYFSAFGPLGPGRMPRAERQAIMREVTSAFGEVNPLSAERGPLLLPEVSIPQEEVPDLERLAKRTRRAVLAGCLWRPVSTVVRGRRVLGAKASAMVSRFLVNEAKLIAPVSRPHDPRFPLFRTFTIRKPVPAIEEHGLCEAVSSNTGVDWRMLRGRTWFRFVHDSWGDFTVAICSDLTDPGPWRSMDGQVLHLLLVSYNKDIELFEQLTWVRAFELHANVVGVNHGVYGGSYVWSPKHDHGKEVARLRGKQLSLVAEVVLPVKELARDQCDGERLARGKAKSGWQSPTTPAKSSGFKSPRPGYRPRRTP